MTFKQWLKSGAFVAGAWAELGNPDIAEALVRSGWPIVVIDGEHGVGDIEAWVAVARAIESAGGEAVLRVPSGDETLLKRVLDRGFRSILVPQVNTAEQARTIVSACHYPPVGHRGYAAPVVRASGFGARPNYARAEAESELMLMIQCEHVEAVANLPEIAAVEGIDMIFVGPNDLAASIGQLERSAEPETQALLKRIEAFAAANGTLLGTVCGAGREWAELYRLGYRFVVGPNDISLLVSAAVGAAAERDKALVGAATASVERRRY